MGSMRCLAGGGCVRRPELFDRARRKVLEIGPIVVNFLYIQKVSSIKLREKLQLSANPTVAKIEKTESGKAYSQG